MLESIIPEVFEGILTNVTHQVSVIHAGFTLALKKLSPFLSPNEKSWGQPRESWGQILRSWGQMNNRLS